MPAAPRSSSRTRTRPSRCTSCPLGRAPPRAARCRSSGHSACRSWRSRTEACARLRAHRNAAESASSDPSRSASRMPATPVERPRPTRGVRDVPSACVLYTRCSSGANVERIRTMLPKRFPDRHEVVAVREEAERLEPGQESNEKRRLAGRVMARREHGKLTFLDLVDRSGRMQLFCQAERVELPNLDLGDVVGVTGAPMKTRRGEPSVAVDSVELLAKIRRPLPDTFHGLTDTEARYRRRYLDLVMNEETREVFLTRTRIVTAV